MYEEAHCPEAHRNGPTINLQMYVRNMLLLLRLAALFPCPYERAICTEHPALLSAHFRGFYLEATKAQIRICQS